MQLLLLSLALLSAQPKTKTERMRIELFKYNCLDVMKALRERDGRIVRRSRLGVFQEGNIESFLSTYLFEITETERHRALKGYKQVHLDKESPTVVQDRLRRLLDALENVYGKRRVTQAFGAAFLTELMQFKVNGQPSRTIPTREN